MPKVTGLTIRTVAGVDNTYYATWKFDAGSKSDASYVKTNVVAGDLVTVNQGAKWYNGVEIPEFVFSDKWIVLQVYGDRAVIDKNQSGTRSINSPINVKDLTKVNGGSGGEVVSIDTLSHYELMWAYCTGNVDNNGVVTWFHGKDATTYAIPGAYDSDAQYSPPENAIKFRVQVRPVSKTYEVNGKETSYWTGEWAKVEQENQGWSTPDVPNAPTVEIDKLTLTAKLENIQDSKAQKIQFEIYDGTKLYNTGTVEVKSAMATYQCQLAVGGEYRVRCRAGGMNLSGVWMMWSDWSDFSGSAGTIPAAPSGFTTIRAASSTSVYLAWGAVSTADTYDIEYATNPDYFQGSNATTTVSGIETTTYTLTGLESGDEYYFRVRAVNDNGESEWSGYKSVIIGKKPAAPTTWSSATTVIVGEPLNLYWVHNSEDGSWASYSQIELYFDGVKETHTIQSNQTDDPDEDDDTEKSHVYSVDTSKYVDGTQIKWRVRTSGITNEFGDWSIQREVNVFARPSLSLDVTNHKGEVFEVLEQFPFHIEAFAGPKTQEPIGYHVSIIAMTNYETVDTIGRPMSVKAGDVLMLKYIDTNDVLDMDISASDVDLADDEHYMIKVVVSMNSGLTAESTREFSVNWTDEWYEPDSEIAIDYNSYAVYLTPYCRDSQGVPIPNLLLSVYRREFDGTYTEIATGLDPLLNTVVADPHPALDYARYRIVATSIITGAVSYYDMPAYPIQGQEVVIQWDEEWQPFDTNNPDPAVTPMWSGSLLKIKGNIDVSDNVTPQATLVNYIGRTYPVSYYGTAIDSTSNWKMDVPKSDKDTLYALRRLQTWKGDVYVREPSGSGYWANIAVSFSQTHKNLVIPVSLDITRVEGGM